MKRLSFSLIVMALAVQGMMSKSITVEQALEVAVQFSNQNQKLSSNDKGQNALKLAYASNSGEGYTDYYVFNCNGDGGFIIVSGDDLSLPVLGYCEHGAFDINAIPDNMRWWLSEYQQQLEWLRSHPEAATPKSPVITGIVGPLLSTTWDQEVPYNNYCPVAYGGPGGHALSGCLATAMAQVMKYYNHPATGDGSHSYTFDLDNTTVTLSADFSQSVYQWDLMLNSYNYGYTIAKADAVARLMSDVGISINMAYGGSGSYAKYVHAIESLIAYFDYSPSTQFLLKNRYTGDWDALLRSEIDARRPVYYFGQKGSNYGSEGHAFVVDGYNNNYFHINWGWGGWCDGYFVSDLFTPYSRTNPFEEGYNTDQGAIIHIEPDRTGTGGIVLKSGITAGGATMPVYNVRAYIELESLGGPYVGELKMALATLSADNRLSWRYSMVTQVSLNAGEQKTIEFKGAYDLVEGQTYYLYLLNPYCKVANYRWCDVVSFVVENIAGDVNCDGEVNIADVNTIVRVIWKSVVDPYTRSLADVNKDGEINIADINAVIDIILTNP